MILNRSIMDRFRDDMDAFASIPVPFRSFVDREGRFNDRDRDESDRFIVNSVQFRDIERRDRRQRAFFRTKSVADRSKTVRSLAEIVAFMSKTVPLRHVMDLFLDVCVRYFRRNAGNVEIRDSP
jgi:hypothetical protein